MAINGCSSGLVVTVIVTLLLLPAQYYLPERASVLEDSLTVVPPAPTSSPQAWLDLAFSHFPPLDLFFTISLFIIGLLIYLCEWIQRKLMERRIVKLNQYLGASVERLRAWDAQQEQLEATLKMVQNATTEYNLLLYLLLRQHRCLAAHNGPPSNCFFDKDLDSNLAFLRGPMLDT